MSELTVSITYALNWCKAQNVDVPLRLMVQARKAGVAAKADIPTNYKAVRDTYWAAVYDSVDGYLNGTSNVRTYQNAMKRALASAYNQAGDIGYVDGGGELPADEDTINWITSEQEAQLAYADGLFQTLKQLRADGDFDAISEAFNRADGYANSLDILYNGAKMAGAKNKMLTFAGDDGAESCVDCQKYKGKRHKASWWIAHNAVPPNRDFQCHGYNCAHVLQDDDGDQFTI